MIIPSLHKEPTALDTVAHRDLLLDTERSAVHLLAPMTSMMISIGEFAEAALTFPILFIRDGSAPDGTETVMPVIAFGLKPNENLYVRNGQWEAAYTPAILRSYPFTMARIEGSGQWAMAVDESWEGLSRSEGQPLFDAQGEATPLLKNIHDFVQQFESDMERTRQACAVLIENKLLKPMRFDATLATGEQLSVDGFMVLDEEALAKKSDTEIAKMFRNSLLHMLTAHQLSLANMRRLVNLRIARQREAEALAASAT